MYAALSSPLRGFSLKTRARRGRTSLYRGTASPSKAVKRLIWRCIWSIWRTSFRPLTPYDFLRSRIPPRPVHSLHPEFPASHLSTTPTFNSCCFSSYRATLLSLLFISVSDSPFALFETLSLEQWKRATVRAARDDDDDDDAIRGEAPLKNLRAPPQTLRTICILYFDPLQLLCSAATRGF